MSFLIDMANQVAMMTWMKNFLTPEQRSELCLAHRQERDQRYADRIKAVLGVDAGTSSIAVLAEYLLVDERTIWRYVALYTKAGLSGLLERKHQGSPGKLTQQEFDELEIWIDENTPKTTKRIQAFIEQEFQVEMSRSAITQMLKRLGFSFIKPQTRPGKAEGVKQEEFLRSYEDLKKNLEPEDCLYFGDAAHPLHNATAAYGWMRKGKPKVLKTNHGRGRLNLNGAMDPRRCDVVVLQEQTMNSDAVIRLCQVLERGNPKAKSIYFISDNAGYYRSLKVKKWLETSRIKLRFLPPYSPNLNIAERLWKYFRQKVMANTYYETFQEFRKASSDCFAKLRRDASHLKSLFSERFQTLPA